MAAALVCGALLFGFIIVLTLVLYKAFLMDKIHTEASQCKREDQSATTTSTMMNLEEVGREFERSVIDEGQGILMDKIHMEASQREREDQSATTTSKMMNFKEVGREFKRRAMDEGQEILRRLDELLGQTIFLGLIPRVPTRPLQRLHAPLVVKESDVVGRDGDKEEIIVLLLSDDTRGKNLSVIPIVGMGGIGKTTLAQLVYKDSRVQQHFDLKVWVTVSEEFNVFQITKGIYEKVVPSEECKTRELFELQSKLNEALAGKRFLFVLDDVWNENYGRWESLKSGFQSGAHGSRIIVTTRSKDVVSTMSNGAMHELKLVSVDDCWQIFVKHAFFDNQTPTKELQKLGLEIVKRCKGLPLAVKSIAGLLRSTSNPEDWRQILDSDIWQLQFQENLKNDIVPALWLSYHFLPPTLKRCFAYCSIFPKDYEFEESDMEKIIWLWMAEGLLTDGKGKRMEDVGKANLQALISRSFFQQSISRWGSSVMVMHDLVHDLAMFISGLELHDLKVGGCLRVLSLSGYREIKEFPNSIGNIKYLRYLDLSNTLIKELPDSICTCYNLQTLLLSLCKNLVRLPTRLAALVNLRHLDIRGAFGIKEMPPQMCKMKSLQTLSDFVLGENDSWRIKELGEFPLLEGSLRISGLEYIVDVKDVLEANLKDKKFLSQLILEWGWRGRRSSQQEREVLEALQPHMNLKQLTIKNYRDTIFPDWVGHESFCNMVKVELENCRNVCMLPPLGQLSSLRSLLIDSLDSVVSIGNEFCGSSSTSTNHPFSSLEDLRIFSMKSWKEWSFSSDRLGQEGSVFPSLTEFRMFGCEKLIMGLPDSHLPSLKRIDISIGKCGKLWENRMKWGLERLPSLMTLSLNLLGVEEEVDSFPEEGLLPTTLTHLSILSCRKLKGLNGRGFQHLTSLRNLDIRDCRELECLPQEGLPLSLSSLTIDACTEVLKQRCQRGTGEDWPKIQHIPKIYAPL